MTTTPVFGFGFTTENDTEAAKANTQNENWLLAEAILKRAIIDRDLSVAPGAPTNGDVYLVPPEGASPSVTGEWLGKEDNLAVYYNGWIFMAPVAGPTFKLLDEGIVIEYDTAGSPASWVTVV